MTPTPDGSTPPDSNGPPDSSGPVCPEGQTRCGDGCVNILTDPGHCGGCNTPCAPGTVCNKASCLGAPETCTPGGCPEDYYCDLGDSKCHPGCGFDEQCDTGELCDKALHSCDCKPSHHRCAGKAGCLPDSATDHKVCNGACAPCPTGPGVLGRACDGSACVATKCAAGYYACGGDCCPWKKELMHSGVFKEYSRLAFNLDSAGKPVAIIEEHYANLNGCEHNGIEKTSSGWKVTNLTKGKVCLDEPMIERGADGTIHVAIPYYDSSYPVWTGKYLGGWKLTRESDNPTQMVAARLSGNTSGDPCMLMAINHIDDNEQFHWLACLSTPTAEWWQSELREKVAGSSKTYWKGPGAGFAIDGSNTPHVVFLNKSVYHLTYATRASGGNWTEEPIAQRKCSALALVLDKAGAPVVAYFDTTDNTLKLARRKSGGAWDVEDVYAGKASSLQLRLTKGGKAVIGHNSGSSSAMLRISRETASGWERLDVGTYNRGYGLRLDSNDKVHLVVGTTTEISYLTQ